MNLGSQYEAKLKLWKVFSQPWSACPRALHGRGVTVTPLAVVVDMVREAVREAVVFKELNIDFLEVKGVDKLVDSIN